MRDYMDEIIRQADRHYELQPHLYDGLLEKYGFVVGDIIYENPLQDRRIYEISDHEGTVVGEIIVEGGMISDIEFYEIH